METATPPTPTISRLPLLGGSLFRPRRPLPAEGHLHFDRAARVWRGHDEPEPLARPLPLQECA
jgi:hypothetical protein